MSKQSLPENSERRLNKRPRPEIPEGYISLRTGIGRVGRTQFGAAWTEVVERNRARERAKAANFLGRPLDGDVVTSKQLQETEQLWDEVRPRYRSAVTRLRDLLSKGKLTAFEFGEGELPRPIKADFWGTSEADQDLETHVDRGLVDRIQLSRWTPGGPQASKNRLVIVPEDALEELLSSFRQTPKEADHPSSGPPSYKQRAIAWEEQQRKLMQEKGLNYRQAAEIIAGDEGLDPYTVERETRRVRVERGKAGN